jgi:hypothetical protein
MKKAEEIRARFKGLSNSSLSLMDKYRKIAKESGVKNPQTVMNIVNNKWYKQDSKHEITKKKIRKKVKDAFEELTTKERKSPVQLIAEKTGISKQAVLKYLREAGLYSGHKRKREEANDSSEKSSDDEQ